MERVTSVQDHAEGQLRLIRAAMERAGAFTAIPGWAGVLLGLVAVGAGVIANGSPTARDWVVVWLAAAGLAVPVGALTLVQRARRAGVDLTTGVARRFVLMLAAPLLAGGVLTVALLNRELYDLLPALWLTLYGTGVVVAGSYSTRLVQTTGVFFVLVGAAAAFVSWPTAALLMTAGFGGVHLVSGVLMLFLDSRERR